MSTAKIETWFAQRGWSPFPFQREVWASYLNGESGLIHATTGTGKTYAAWIGPLIEALAQDPPTKPPPLRVLWITPLRALAADTEEALRTPLDDLGLPWTLETRTGDTSSAVRARQRKRLPSALITTPESLSLLLSRTDAENLFSKLRLVVVDEWHELMSTKRGVQTELALARLRHWQTDLRIWGLSATLGNIDAALATLLGTGHSHRPGRLVRGIQPKSFVVDSIIPDEIERFPWAGHLGLRLLPQVVEILEQSQSALIFTNTRAQTETWYQALLDARPEWAGEIALHHSSLAREARDWVEQALRDGRLRCVVCTSSLDLGVDFTPVDTVLQIGSPKGIARLLQRAGRSGHQPGANSHVICVPTSAFELIEVAAARDAMANGRIEARPPFDRPLDVLVQHVITIALGGGFRVAALLEEVRTTHAFRDLSNIEWQWILDFATRGGPALQNYPDYTRVVEQDGVYTVPDDRTARRHRISIGTIISDTSLQVQYVRGPRLGNIEESFAARLRSGDKFVFAGRILEFVRVRDMKVLVRRSNDTTGITPRWVGSRMPLSSELAQAVRAKLNDARAGVFDSPEMKAIKPVLRLQLDWSHLPMPDELLIERTQTREGHHLFIYPFEGRLVHEGLSALAAYRISQLQPISFTIAINDYGFELLSPEPAPLDEALSQGLFTPANLLDDIIASLNASEMAKRQFREIARIAGLVYQGYPGEKTTKQFQVSSSLIYDVLQQHDPQNRLLDQAQREVLERQLEQSRLQTTLERLAAGHTTVIETKRPTPFAFPLLVDRLHATVSSEKFADRVRKMQLSLEKAIR
ncbi:MAG: ligase-associated DNA damage response DEXH box helicase [Chloroflexota bacterium]